VAFCVALALALLFAPEARAFERQHHLGVDGGLSMLSIADKSTVDVGAGFGLHYTYGLTDAFNLVVEGASAIVAKGQLLDDPMNTPHTRPSTVSSFAVGAVYVLDVLRWVPYGGVLAGGYLMGGGTLDRNKILGGVQFALGLDYQLTRSWAVGVAYRQHMIYTDLSTYPSYSTFFGRVEYIWGW
jgi:hypothetical protein